ncbi:Hypothetical predicted protein [Lecanosticta acicola]|uniref:Arrestin-like N-terminal domain-containing protein n=1 Tax=Lecanosticta acicola TaxID=111012 RepID=A0AAI9EB25_9PEZI|nr:Hypothetical predicted protein [Lecanosticta acicola]
MAFKLGQLEAQIYVDYRGPYYGSDDPINGRIVLSYQPRSGIFKKQSESETAALFGPLKIFTVLRGNVAIRVRRDNDLPTLHGIEVLQKADAVFDGSFKADVGGNYEFPFSLNFPDGSNLVVAQGYSQDLPLPPSFYSHFSHYPDVVDIAIKYFLGVHVDLPGIDVKVNVPKQRLQPELKFDLPRPPKDLFESNLSTFTERAVLQSSNLLPEDQRPQGFKQKAKAVFSSSHFPKLALDVSCTQWHYICPGHNPSFEIVVRRSNNDSTSPTFPEVSLEFFRVKLVAYTSANTAQRVRGKPLCSDNDIVQRLECRTNLPLTYSKANDYTHRVGVDPIAQLPSSFKHLKVSRSYQFKITMHFKVAEETVKVKKKHPVVLIPHPVEPMQLGENDAGPSRAGTDQAAGPSRHGDEDEALPRYEDAVTSAPGSK